MHEAATVSGVAAACRLGVPYQGFDDVADEIFRRYMHVCHGKRLKNVGKDGQRPSKGPGGSK